MATEFVALLRCTIRRAFRDEILLVWAVPAGESLQGSLAVDLLNADSRSEGIGPLVFRLTIRPKAQGNPPSKSSTCGREVKCDAREIEREIESNQQATPLVFRAVQPINKFATAEQPQFRTALFSSFRTVRGNVFPESLLIAIFEIITVEQAFL